jgi:hypothetical protein
MVPPTADLWAHTQKIFNQTRYKPFCHKMQHNTPFTFYRVTLGRIVTLQSTFRQLTAATLQSKNATCVTVTVLSAFPPLTNVYVYSEARREQTAIPEQCQISL